MNEYAETLERLEVAIVNFGRFVGRLRAAVRETDDAHEAFGDNSINYEVAKSAEAVAVEELDVAHEELLAIRRRVASLRRAMRFSKAV